MTQQTPLLLLHAAQHCCTLQSQCRSSLYCRKLGTNISSSGSEHQKPLQGFQPHTTHHGPSVHPLHCCIPVQGCETFIERQTTTHTFTHWSNLESHLTSHACCWTVGGNDNAKRNPIHAQGEHGNSADKDPAGI